MKTCLLALLGTASSSLAELESIFPQRKLDVSHDGNQNFGRAGSLTKTFGVLLEGLTDCDGGTLAVSRDRGMTFLSSQPLNMPDGSERHVVLLNSIKAVDAVRLDCRNNSSNVKRISLLASKDNGYVLVSQDQCLTETGGNLVQYRPCRDVLGVLSAASIWSQNRSGQLRNLGSGKCLSLAGNRAQGPILLISQDCDEALSAGRNGDGRSIFQVGAQGQVCNQEKGCLESNGNQAKMVKRGELNDTEAVVVSEFDLANGAVMAGLMEMRDGAELRLKALNSRPQPTSATKIRSRVQAQA